VCSFGNDTVDQIQQNIAKLDPIKICWMLKTMLFWN